MRSETKRGTSNRTVCDTKRYGLLAVMAGLFLFGGLLLIEHLPLVHLTANVMFCVACAGLLLFALMKLNVMEFQPGSFWYNVNQYVNRETTAVRKTGKQAARSTVYAMIIHK